MGMRKAQLPMATIMKLQDGQKISRRHAIAAVRNCAIFCEVMLCRGAKHAAALYASEAMRIAQSLSELSSPDQLQH